MPTPRSKLTPTPGARISLQPQSFTPRPPKSGGKGKVWILIIIALLVAAGIVIYQMQPQPAPPPPVKRTPPPPPPKPKPKPKPEPEPEPEPQPNPYASSISLTGGSTALQKEWSSFIDHLLEAADVEQFSEATEERIKEGLPQLFSDKSLKYGAYRTSTTLMQAIELCYLIRHAGAEAVADIISPAAGKGEADGSGRSFIRWLLTDRAQPLHHFMQSFKLNSGHPDQLAYSIQTFYELWKKTEPRERAKYLNLAIACSIVHKNIATSHGMLRDQSIEPLSMPELYSYFVSMDAKGKLLTDVKKLSVSDLLHVVDVRLPQSEFDWVHKNLNYKRADWGQAYGSVKYVMERATQGKDLYTTYTFAELRKEGGVCRDQGYFAANTAKCVGIPATYITGDGDRGGHAWIAILANDKEWKGTGSYGYKTGRFRNPCSCRAQHESMLLQRDKKMTDDKLETAANLLLLSEYAGELELDKEALITIQYVTTSYPLLTAGWVSRMEVLKTQNEKEPLDKSVWKRLHTDLSRGANKNGELLDLAQEVENDYILKDTRDSVKKNILKRSSRKLERMVDEGRADLMIEGLERQANLYVEAGDYLGLARFYKPYYKKYATKGDIFGAILNQHEKCLSGVEDKKIWLSLAKELDRLYGKKAYDGDFFKVKKDAGVMKKIASFYERGGDQKKADKITEEADKKLDASASKAEGH